MNLTSLKKRINSKTVFTDINGSELNVHDPVFCVYKDTLYNGIVLSFKTKTIEVKLFGKTSKETICCYPHQIGILNKNAVEFINKQVEQTIEFDKKRKSEKVKRMIYLMYINNTTNEYGITVLNLKIPSLSKNI